MQGGRPAFELLSWAVAVADYLACPKLGISLWEKQGVVQALRHRRQRNSTQLVFS